MQEIRTAVTSSNIILLLSILFNLVELLLYNFFLWGYRFALKMVSPWNSKARRWVNGRVGLMEKIAAEFSNQRVPLIWMHCASLGEFEQGRPVLEKLKAFYPRHKFLLTFYSPSGYEIRKDYSGV